MSDDGLRRLAPTGALAVGDPPVAVAAILRAVEGARRSRPAPGSYAARPEDEHPADARNAAELEAARAAARRAFPRLTDEELDRALAHDPEAAAPTPSWSAVLGAALPLGLGALWASDGVGLATSALLGGSPSGWPHGAQLLGALLGVLAIVLGVALMRLDPRARPIAAALHGLAGVGVLALLTSLEVDQLPEVGVLLLLTFGVAAGLFGAGVRPWFTPEGRAARAALPTQPYLAAVAFANLLSLVAIFVVPAFHRMFKEVGVALPPPTEAVLWVSDLCASWSWLAWPALVLAPLPLLRLSPRHERPAFQAALLLGVFCMGSILGALLLPLFELVSKL